MTVKNKLLISLGIACIAATAATAQDASIDLDGDGMYSFPELLVIMPDMTDEAFTTMDSTGDGLLDAEEIAAATEAGLLPAMEG